MKPYIRKYPDELTTALKPGGMATTDRTITATWTGVFHYDPDEPQRSGKVRRWIDVRAIDDVSLSKNGGQ